MKFVNFLNFWREHWIYPWTLCPDSYRTSNVDRRPPDSCCRHHHGRWQNGKAAMQSKKHAGQPQISTQTVMACINHATTNNQPSRYWRTKTQVPRQRTSPAVVKMAVGKTANQRRKSRSKWDSHQFQTSTQIVMSCNHATANHHDIGS